MNRITTEIIDISNEVTLEESLISAAVGSEMVVLHASTYYDTDAVGADIWRRLAQPIAVNDLCGALADSYDVDRDTCQRDVLAFLQDAHREGLVRILR